MLNPRGVNIQLQDFVRAIMERREPLVNGEERRKSVELMLALYRSGRTGQPVSLRISHVKNRFPTLRMAGIRYSMRSKRLPGVPQTGHFSGRAPM